MNSTELCREWLASLPKAHSILEKIQQKARESLLKREGPSIRDENWRLSNLKRLEKFISLPVSQKYHELSEEKYSFVKNIPKNIIQITVDTIQDQLASLNLPKGITKLTNKELEQYLGATLNLCECKEEWPILINESSASQVIGLKIKGRFKGGGCWRC